MLFACSGGRTPAPVDDRSAHRTDRPVAGKHIPGWVTVRRGDTLYSISFAHGYDFKTIARLNGIRSPYTIYPGQRLRLESVAPIKGKISSKPKVHAVRKMAPRPDKPVKEVTRQHVKINWQWPVRGKILRRYSSRLLRKKGIGITGRENQPVVAAALGEVVYSGDGLIGYGNLIIVKHDETYLSAYAHNSRVFVKEGQQLKRGERIALMGVNENNAPMLHFEIRRNGKPVNPLNYLPK